MGENIRAIESLGIDLMGFILYAKSPRFVADMPEYMPSSCRRVGVFVNESLEVIEAAVERFGLDTVQLHGSESADMCRALRRSGVEVFKAISVGAVSDLSVAEQYDGVCDMLVFDTKCEGHGGSGEQFDWSILGGYKGQIPFLLSGGISADSVVGLRSFSHPMLAGYDINSRFESAAAMKDVELIAQFLKVLNG